MDKGVWAIGDIHGCAKTFKALLARVQPRIAYTLGDYCDRGPRTKQVIDLIMGDSRIRPLLGNHEDIFLQVYDNPTSAMVQWFVRNGGLATLESFGVSDIRQVPKKYVDWMRSLPAVRRYGNVILSHAGANLNKRRPFDDREYLLWNREVPAPNDPAWTIVVGHTIVDAADSAASVDSRKVMIDTGCCRGGMLTAYNIHTHELIFEPYID